MVNDPSQQEGPLWQFGPEENPLDVLDRAHDRQRRICADLNSLAASNTPDPNLARAVLTYLRADLPLHFADEEESLFPLLRRKAARQDEIDRALTRLRDDHDHTNLGAGAVQEVLEHLIAGDVAGPKSRALLLAYADHELRHLMIEDAIVLPLARRRLSPADLRQLRDMMRQRRASQGGGGVLA